MSATPITPQRVLSPAEELEQIREKRLAEMSQNLPPEHYGLHSVLKKKHPSQMARIIAQSFEQFYPEIPELQGKVLKHLYPDAAKKQPIPFVELNRRLASLENIFDEDSPCLELIESLRQIFEVLPKPGNPYRKERITHSEDKSFPPEKIEYLKCRFCWRTVWRYPIENGIPRCSFHDFKSTGSEYKKRKLLAKKAIPILNDIHGVFQLLQRDMQAELKFKLENEEYALMMCFTLPHVRDFILNGLKNNARQPALSLLKDGLDEFVARRESVSLWDIDPRSYFEYMHSHTPPGAELIRAIIDILDPAVNLSGSLVLAREQFVLDMTWNFAAYISYIYEAEAWLMAEEESKHGGSRKHVGENL